MRLFTLELSMQKEGHSPRINGYDRLKGFGTMSTGQDQVKSSFRHHNYAVWMAVFTAIVIIGTLLTLRGILDYRRNIHLLEERLLAQARVIDENLHSNLAAISLILENIRHKLVNTPANEVNSFNHYLKMQIDFTPDIRTILITDSQGRCIHSTRDVLLGQDFSNRDYFKTPRAAADKSQTFMSPPFNTMLGTFVINITKPIIGQQGEFKGVISASLKPDYFLTLLKSTVYAPDNRIGLVHSDGTVFIAVPDGENSVTGQNLMKPNTLFMRHIQGGAITSIQRGHSATTGDERVFAYITNTPKELHFDKHLIVAASRNLAAVLISWQVDTAIQLALYLLLSALAIVVTKKMLQRSADQAKSAEYNRALLDSMQAHIAILDQHGVIVSVNDAWKNFAAANRTQAGQLPHATGVGTNYLDVCRACIDENKEQIDHIIAGISSVLKGSLPTFTSEYACHSPDIQRWFFVSVEPLRTSDGGAVVTHVNITARKAMEEALRRSEERLQRMFRSHGAVMLLIAPNDGAIVDANPSAENFYGYSREKLLQMNIAEINMLPPAEIQSEMQRAQTLHRNYFVFKHKQANGAIRTVEVYSSPITIQDKPLLFSIIHDITDRKLAEEALRNVERKILHSQKLESLVRMSGGIAHDFNNILQAVLGNLELTLMKLLPDAPGRQHIEAAITSAERAAELSKMMLAYSGQGFLDHAELNLTRLVEKNAAMLNALIPPSITLKFQLTQALPFVKVDAEQIQQVIMNMLNNAGEAIGPGSGLITLSTGVNHFTQTVLDTSPIEDKLNAGRYVWLEVRDTGCGMDGDTQYKLFDPFFSTKFTGRGLGMSAAYGIIRAHQGAFLVESSPGHGSIIRFLLPIAESPAA
jgi:PAS domain S-box-containing protein